MERFTLYNRQYFDMLINGMIYKNKIHLLYLIETAKDNLVIVTLLVAYSDLFQRLKTVHSR